jgi:ribosomal protein S27AE
MTRKKYKDFAEEERIKANARSYLNVYIRRGKVVKKPCEVCGDKTVQAYHDDYKKPLEVRWMCRKHHKEYHVKENN